MKKYNLQAEITMKKKIVCVIAVVCVDQVICLEFRSVILDKRIPF